MCGIVGIVSERSVSARLIEGLRRLEYRGYDSAGIATNLGGEVHRRRAVGKLVALETVLETEPLGGTTGIGHTRWATHGKPTALNAHPHGGAKVAIVHNGIIENFSSLKKELQDAGVPFESDTDSEVIARLMERELDGGADPKRAFQQALQSLQGAFAIGAVKARKTHAQIASLATRRCDFRFTGLHIRSAFGKGRTLIAVEKASIMVFWRIFVYQFIE